MFFEWRLSKASNRESFKHVLQKKPITTVFSALPPPVLPPFCPLFASLVNILQSDGMLCVLRTILRWAVEHNGCAWSEAMLQRVGLQAIVVSVFYSKRQDSSVRVPAQDTRDKWSVARSDVRYIVTAAVPGSKVQARHTLLYHVVVIVLSCWPVCLSWMPQQWRSLCDRQANLVFPHPTTTVALCARKDTETPHTYVSFKTWITG